TSQLIGPEGRNGCRSGSRFHFEVRRLFRYVRLIVRRLPVLGFLALLMTLTPPAFASSLYRRVDEEGVTHFTHAPTDPRFKHAAEAAPARSARGANGLPDVPRTPHTQEVESLAPRHRVDADLVEAVIRVESAFNPRAVSNKGAQGLMQLMPRTASALGVRNVF